MTAPILSVFGTVAETDDARAFLTNRALRLLKRPIHHHFCGTLWERVAEGRRK